MNNTFNCIGIMSGSSLDGMDVVHVKVRQNNGGYDILDLRHHFQPFNADIKKMALKIGSENLLYESALYSTFWSNTALKAISQLIKKYSLSLNQIDVIGVHGQTVLHRPKPVKFLKQKIKCTVQLANLSLIAEKTGITTVGNFRQRDIAAGGDGAPLMPSMHKLLYGSAFPCLSVHNLGGISNATIISDQKIVSAFDTGPANIWIDTVIRWHTRGKLNMDKNGSFGRKGSPDEKLVLQLLKNPYFKKRPPKSTGWEEFGQDALSRYKKPLMKMKMVDAVATVTSATVTSIVDAYQKFVLPHHPIESIIFSGGGAKNSFMLEEIQKRLPRLKVQTSENYGISTHETEALGFALLGLENLLGKTSNAPEATGAKNYVLCGEIAIGTERTHVDRLKKFFQSAVS